MGAAVDAGAGRTSRRPGTSASSATSLNSVIVTGGSVVTTILFSAMAAYALTRHRIPFAGAITVLLLGGMMLAPTVALIPLFRLLQAIGIFNTYWALIILYTAFRIPFTVFLIRAYMITLSREMEDAAIVDGASRWQIFWLVVMPLSRPIIVSAALLQALFAWNEFVFALVFINDTDLKTLPVGLLADAGAGPVRLAGPLRRADDRLDPDDRPVPGRPAPVHPGPVRGLRQVARPARRATARRASAPGSLPTHGTPRDPGPRDARRRRPRRGRVARDGGPRPGRLRAARARPPGSASSRPRRRSATDRTRSPAA